VKSTGNGSVRYRSYGEEIVRPMGCGSVCGASFDEMSQVIMAETFQFSLFSQVLHLGYRSGLACS